MIVKTFSDIRIRAFLEGKQAELNKGEVCVVAIRGGAEDHKVGWHPNVLQLCFDDDYPSGPVTDQQIKEWRSVLFSEEHAAKVQNFFTHVRELKCCRMLAVNCSKGTSRSGAIAAYAATFFAIPGHIFYRHNRNISPNPWVLRKLGLELDEVLRRLAAGQRILENHDALA